MDRKGQDLSQITKLVLMAALIIVLIVIIAVKWKEIVGFVAKIKSVLA